MRSQLFSAFMACLALSFAASSSAAVLATEDFNFTGALTDNGWTAHSSAGSKQILSDGSDATLQQGAGAGEDVNLAFAPQGATAKTFASFDVTVLNTLSIGNGDLDANGLYFAHFKDAATNFPGRVFVTNPGAGGDFSFGIEVNDASVDQVWASDFSFDTQHKVVLAYDAGTGFAELWLDPVNESSIKLVTTNFNAGTLVESFALRQSGDYTGNIQIDNVAVGTDFASVFFVWDGSIGNWDTDASWLGGVEPTINDDVTINGGTVNVTMAGEVAKHVQLDGGSLVVDAGNLSTATTGTAGLDINSTMSLINSANANVFALSIGTTTAGSVVVDGAASQMTVTSPSGLAMPKFKVGVDNVGSLSIVNGATFLYNPGDSAQFVILGEEAGSGGPDTVSDDGSRLTVDGLGSVADFNSNRLNVGQFDDAHIRVTNSGVLRTGYGVISDQAGSAGSSAIVSGPGSQWIITNGGLAGNLDVGQHEQGSLLIENGGFVSAESDFQMGLLQFAGAPSTATVTGIGSQLSVTGIGLIGGSDVGATTGSQSTLSVLDGATAQFGGGLNIANEAMTDGSSVTADGVGSVLTVSGQTNIGLNAAGHLLVDNGGVATTGLGQVGVFVGSGGSTATVTGAGSQWNLTGDLFVGRFDSGNTLTVSNGGSVSTTGFFRIANDAGTLGSSVIVDGANSALLSGGEVRVGGMSPGHLTVSNGGLVTTGPADVLFMGTEAGSGGSTVTVTGLNSQLNVGTDLFVGRFAPSSLSVSGGGAVTANEVNVSFFTGSDNSDITVSGSGSSLDAASRLTIGAGRPGTMVVEQGASVSSNNKVTSALIIAGGGSTAGSSLTVRDPGSSITTNGFVAKIGNLSDGDLFVGNGGAVNTGAMLIAVETGSGGSGVTVTDVGSQVVASGTLSVGVLAPGSLAISNGATVTAGGFSDIASGIGSGGSSATVSGLGSRLDVSGRLTVGQRSPGSLLIDSGGVVTSGVDPLVALIIGGDGGSAGSSVTVRDPGSVLDNNGLIARIGNLSWGRLLVENGGTARTGDATIGFTTASGGSHVIVSGAGSQWDVAGSLNVASLASSTLFVHTGGDVTVSNGMTIGASGTLDFDGGTINVNGGLNNAAGGTIIHTDGTLTITNGAFAPNVGGPTHDYVIDGTGLGDNPTVVLGAGSIATLQRNVFVGGSSAGTLNIEAGGQLSDSFGVLGEVSGSMGTVNVTGLGSTWANSANLIVGKSGIGSLNVEAGGQVSNIIGSIGDISGSTGTATITGTGSTWASSTDLYIGNLGTGTLNVEAGGQVSSTTGIIGNSPGSTGTATVTGIGSMWNNSASLVVGGGGDGTLRIESGGQVTNGLGFIGGSSTGSVGVVTVTGPGSSWTNSLDLLVGNLGTGTLNVEAGGQVSNGGDADIGDSITSMGTATVTGPGSTWTISNNLFVGDIGTGTLNVDTGGQVSSTSGSIGNNGDSVGMATVTGAGSTWTNSQNLVIGFDGNGTMNIEAGGQVSNVIGRIGENGVGLTTVTGAGSAWNNSGDLTVGKLGAGTLNIQDGGLVSSTSGLIGDLFLSTGTTTVTGAGSTWTNSLNLFVGNGGNGTLNVEAGGLVTNIDSFIAASVGTVSTANVTGPGSAWTSAGDLIVGGIPTTAGGTAGLTIQDSGLVQVGGTFKVWTAGTVTLDGGTLTLDGPIGNGGGTFDYIGGVLKVNDPAQDVEFSTTGFSLSGLPPNTSPASFGPDDALNVTGDARIDTAASLVMSGGTVTSASLLVQPGSSVVSTAGSSTVGSAVVALAGASIDVTGGDLTIGDAAAANGFYSNGNVTVAGGTTLTLEDANDAVLDSGAFVTLGGTNAATLAALNGITLDFGGNITGFGTINTPDDPFKPLINNGHITGNSALEPITLTGYVKGVGTLDNVVITGTDAPGFSPASVFRGSVNYAGTLEVEIGGLTAGSFDILNHSGIAILGGVLDLALINGFTPDLGDTFQFITAASRIGEFDSILGADLGGGLAFDVLYGLNDVTLQVISTTLIGDLDGDGFVGITDLNIVLGNWNQNVPPGDPLADPSGDGFIGIADLNTVLGNWNAGTPPSEAANIPEPSTLILLAICCVSGVGRCRGRLRS